MADASSRDPLTRIQPDAVPASEAPFSQVVLDDNYAFFAGLVAADFAEGQAVLGDVGAETREVLAAIGRMLELQLLERERIVQVNVHLADLDDFDAMDSAYREFFDGPDLPARTTVESRRPFGGSKVEINSQVRR